MTTRLVSIDQIAAGPRFTGSPPYLSLAVERRARKGQQIPAIRVRQIADPTGGDVFETIDTLEAAMIEGLRRAKWPHPVQVEVVT